MDEAMTVKVTCRHNIDAPMSDAWVVLGDFGSILQWVVGGSEATIHLTGSGPGMLRDLDLPSVGKVQHRLDVLDQGGHRIVYSLTAGRPLGMIEYSVSAQLLDRPGGGCILEWLGEFTPEPDASAEQMAEGLESAYEDLSKRFNELLGNPGPA
jgi:hypothetical protein